MLAPACGGGRDVIPESHDVRVASGAGRAREEGGYEHVAKRPLAVVGLAEGRGLDPAEGARVTESLADSLDGCARELARSGRLVDGAARIAARISPDGSQEGLALRFAPGDAVKANALLCFVAPFKLVSFTASSGEGPARGIALEATWGPHVQGAVGLGGGDGG